MKKELLETFVKKYNLAGTVPKVKWKYSVKDQTLHARAAADNRSFIVDVVMSGTSDFGTEDAVICIGDTDKVKSMLSPFSEDVNVSIERKGDRILGVQFSNPDIECYCTAADPSAIDPVAKNLQDVPDYHVVVPLTEEFLETFLKARSALKDVGAFSVGMNKKGVFEMVIGYTTANSNRIRMTPKTDSVKNKLGAALAFPIANLAEVFKANSEIPDGVLSINENGIIRAYFKNDKYTCTYYQFANKKS